MDVLLLAASTGFTYYIGDDRNRVSAYQAILGLSLFLFSVAVIEPMPSSLRLILRDQDALILSYALILLALSIMVLIIIPGRLGVHLVHQLAWTKRRPSSLDPDDVKNRRPSLKRRIIIGCASLLVWPLSCLCRYLFRRRQTRPSSPTVLPLNSRSGDDAEAAERQLQSQRTLIGGAAGFLVSTLLLGCLTPLVVNTWSRSLVPRAVAAMCAVGLILSAVLNGFGSVSMPHACLAGLYLAPIRSETIVQAEVELGKVKESLEERRRQLNANLMTPPGSSANMATTRPRRNSFVDLGEEVTQRREAVRGEVDFLTLLVEEMSEDLKEMRHAQQMALQARTPVGRVRSWLGVVFSLVLVVRLMSAALSAWPQASSREEPRGDIVTTILLWLLGHKFVKSNEFDMWSQFISLVLTAVLSVSQVRTFLRTASMVQRKLRTLSQKCSCPREGTSDGLLAQRDGIHSQIVGALMGCYFVACVVLTKMMLPKEHRVAFTMTLNGPYRLVVRSSTVNAVFLLSAVVSAVVLGMLLGIQRQNSYRNQLWSSDLSSGNGSKNLDP